MLGHDHPDTLTSANSLAVHLSRLGQHKRARQLNEDTLTRRRQVLGEDHPDTLGSAHNLAVNLRGLGERKQARQLKKMDPIAARVLTYSSGPMGVGAFSPNGTTLATGSSYDGTVSLWDLTALNSLRDHATERACSITRGGLERDEWARYIPGLPYQNTCAT